MDLSEKKQKFAYYCKKRLLSKGLVTQNDICRLSDYDILESYRLDARTQEPLYSIEEQNQALLENDTMEDVYNAIDNLIGLKFIDQENDELKVKHKDNIPNYVACFTSYLDGNEDEGIARVSIAITDLWKDEVIYQKDAWSKDGLDIDSILNKWIPKIKEYKGCKLHCINEPIPLEKCACGCNDYYINFISLDDYTRGLEYAGYSKNNVGKKFKIKKRQSKYTLKDLSDSLPVKKVILAWYDTEVEYLKMKKAAVDPENFYPTYKEWLESAILLEKEIKKKHKEIERSVITTNGFKDWCEVNNCAMDTVNRSRYAQVNKMDS